MNPPKDLKILIIRGAVDGSWYAQCLDYHADALGTSIENVKQAFIETLNSRTKISLEYGVDFWGEPAPAAEKYQQAAERGKLICEAHTGQPNLKFYLGQLNGQ